MTAPVTIVDLTGDRPDLVRQTAEILNQAFHGRSAAWSDLQEAQLEVQESLADGRISRVALDADGRVIGWIGGIRMYSGQVWEIHPLVVAAGERRKGVGRALVEDLARLVSARGALTLWAGSDDENGETSLSGIDLYPDIPGAIRGIRNFKGHPFEFYLRLGFKIIGVMPDANGRGKPDIFLARRVG
jgi:aminoglycoside 6'-N-acetyltransferase I